MKTKSKLRIADTIIEMRSHFPLEQLTETEKKNQASERFDNFFYKGSKKPDIIIDIDIVDKLPEIGRTEILFITTHFQDGSENWRLLKKGDSYIYKCPLKDKTQLMLVNKNFNRVKAYLLPKKHKGKAWNSTDIIYDFLQVLLINYFAKRRDGIFVHSIGVKDLDGGGLLFAGKSGAGKSTTARLWHKHSKAMVLNDDRIIVRKRNNKYVMYGCPWHGEFSDYLASRIESAPLEKFLFIYHAKKNTAWRIRPKEAFCQLYPALFPPFWDKNCLENTVSFSQAMVQCVSCYALGFVNNKKVIDFVRKEIHAKKTKV